MKDLFGFFVSGRDDKWFTSISRKSEGPEYRQTACEVKSRALKFDLLNSQITFQSAKSSGAELKQEVHLSLPCMHDS